MVIFDLEWNRGYDFKPLEEILQIGAVRLDKLGGPIISTFYLYQVNGGDKHGAERSV